MKRPRLSLLDGAGYARIARKQKAQLRDLAERIERGEPLGQIERRVVAAVLRAHADRMPETMPRKAGRAPQINRSAVALEFEQLTRRGMTRNGAREHLAEKHGVSVEAIRQALADKRQDAADFLDLLQYPSK